MRLLISNLRASIICFLIISFCACNAIGERGNGNVVTKTRATENFNGIKVSTGIMLVVKQANETKVEVTTDENLQDKIHTEVHNGILEVFAKGSIINPKILKVSVTTPNLNRLESSSGSHAETNGIIKTDDIEIHASSGSRLIAAIEAKSVRCSTSSGSNMKLEGKTDNLDVKSSSGSNLNASGLESLKCIANSSSGSNCTVNVKEDFNGNASSGSNISYKGNPKKIESHKSSGGDINRK
ncbi:MAG: head GIN domain-containing protein [Bacteroidota bacterium]|nr:head GIN domain-containing protein [Bacteroidota bacterium]MDP4205688.1 head GIN domain-containing protein [Bacteroidota bacterium]